MNRIELIGLPPSINKYYGFRHSKKAGGGHSGYGDRYLLQSGKRYKQDVRTQSLGKGLDFPPKPARYFLNVELRTKNYRKMDINNRIKPLEDALTDIIYPDDSMIWYWSTRRIIGEPEQTIVNWYSQPLEEKHDTRNR